MTRKRVGLDEFEVPVPRGYECVTDKDDTADYLFVNAPKDLYTLYFHSGMPLYDQSILNGCEESGTTVLKLQDRRIYFYYPSRSDDQNVGLLYFNIEFPSGDDEVLFLPGQLLINSHKVYRQTEDGTLPFINILKRINLKIQAFDTAVAVSV